VNDETPRPRRSPERQAAIRAAMAELNAEYARALPGRIAELSEAIADARRGEAPPDLPRIRLLAHRIRGTAGSCGWEAVGEAAGRIEDTVDKAGGTLSEAALQTIEAALAEAQAALSTPPTPST